MTSAAVPDGQRGDDDRGGLRAALSGLTTRGRSFLAAGVAAAVCAYVLGQADLLRVGLLLAVLPLICVLVLHRTRYRVATSRLLTPQRVETGTEARVRLRMENVSKLPTGLLMLQDHVPYMLGSRPVSSSTGSRRAGSARCPTGSARTCADAFLSGRSSCG